MITELKAFQANNDHHHTPHPYHDDDDDYDDDDHDGKISPLSLRAPCTNMLWRIEARIDIFLIIMLRLTNK